MAATGAGLGDVRFGRIDYGLDFRNYLAGARQADQCAGSDAFVDHHLVMVGRSPRQQRAAEAGRFQFGDRRDPARARSLRYDLQNFDFGRFQIFLVSQLPAMVVAGGAEIGFQFLVGNFQYHAVDVVVDFMPDGFDVAFEVGDQFGPRAGPGRQQCKRIKHRSMVLNGLLRVFVQFFFLDDAGLKIPRVVEKVGQIAVEITAADYDFAGAQPASALVGDLQAAFEHAADVLAFAAVAAGIQHPAVVVGGVAVQLRRDLELQVAKFLPSSSAAFSMRAAQRSTSSRL